VPLARDGSNKFDMKSWRKLKNVRAAIRVDSMENPLGCPVRSRIRARGKRPGKFKLANFDGG
jgi:hypothetical protein